jgi:hypothetical protein
VLRNDILAAIERQLEAKPVRPGAALQDVVGGRKWLVSKDLDAPLRGRRLARIGAAEKRVVADSALHRVRAEAADKQVIAAAALQPVVARTTPERVVLGSAKKHVVAGLAGDRIGAATAHQDVARSVAQQMIVIGRTKIVGVRMCVT